MSILFRTIKDPSIGTIFQQVFITSAESHESFKKLVRRALNTWDEAPAELKEFGDILEFGAPLQDYKSQR